MTNSDIRTYSKLFAVRIRVRFHRWITIRGNGSCEQAQQYYTAAFHFVSLSLGTEAIIHSVFNPSKIHSLPT